MSSIGMLEPDVSAAATVRLGDAPSRLRAVLDEFGFAIVTDVLALDEVAAMKQLWRADLAGIVKGPDGTTDVAIRQAALEDPIANWPATAHLGRPFATQHGLPHGRMPWAIRSHPNVRVPFEILFGTPDLCVGTDVVFFRNAPAEARVPMLTPHVDQNYTDKPSGDWEIYQSVVYLSDASDTTSTTTVWPRSHLLYDTHLAGRDIRGFGHYIPVSGGYITEFGVRARRLPVPAGAMVMWNSRTVHDGWNNGPRLAVPVCFEPTGRRDACVLKEKLGLVKAGAPTTHWASLGIQHDCWSSARGVSRNAPFQVMFGAHLHCLDGDGNVKEEFARML